MAIVETYKGPAINFGIAPRKRVVVFDLDGVLFDSANHAADFYLATYPTLTREKLQEFMTGNLHDEMNTFRIDNKPIEETEEQKAGREKEYTEKKVQLPLYPGIHSMLETLHASGYVLAINTAALDRNCLPLLEKTDILKFFDFVATKDTAPRKPEKFKIIADKYGVKPEEMIFITDTLGDLRDAKEAGVPTIAVTWGAHDASYFKREPHKNLVAIVGSVEDLLKTIKNVLQF